MYVLNVEFIENVGGSLYLLVFKKGREMRGK